MERQIVTEDNERVLRKNKTVVIKNSCGYAPNTILLRSQNWGLEEGDSDLW